ncbi:hypothetical protein BD410DRAFT_214192 [Rickenella mellea]|uniref:Uncharacterized protein n=1 Tax=Rickenella mellea TaxID=50990 RepID=A0A4Y7QMK4_9AGAM|nr:hypothetical protein BD410DRAFT_214192 [Rickenella mellea]
MCSFVHARHRAAATASPTTLQNRCYRRRRSRNQREVLDSETADSTLSLSVENSSLKSYPPATDGFQDCFVLHSICRWSASEAVLGAGKLRQHPFQFIWQQLAKSSARDWRRLEPVGNDLGWEKRRGRAVHLGSVLIAVITEKLSLSACADMGRLMNPTRSKALSHQDVRLTTRVHRGRLFQRVSTIPHPDIRQDRSWEDYLDQACVQG